MATIHRKVRWERFPPAMPDIFICYARTAADQAGRVSEALTAGGYQVWRDDQLPAHLPYGDVIEERLAAAKAVLVLWSADAARSQWVRAEADVARQSHKLVQASLDATLPPMPFNQIHCVSLATWSGAADDAWRRLLVSVDALRTCVRSPLKKRALSARVRSVSVLMRVRDASDEEGSLKPMCPSVPMPSSCRSIPPAARIAAS